VAVSSYYGAKSQKEQLRFQATMSDLNAKTAELGAQAELAKGQREEQAVRLKTGQLKSRQLVAMAANGIDLSSDTAQNILNTTDVMGEIDAQTVAENAIRQAWGYRTQGVNAQNEALFARATSRGISPGMAAASSLLGDAGQVAGNWYTMKKLGG
jgi:hypothetical protein